MLREDSVITLCKKHGVCVCTCVCTNVCLYMHRCEKVQSPLRMYTLGIGGRPQIRVRGFFCFIPPWFYYLKCCNEGSYDKEK